MVSIRSGGVYIPPERLSTSDVTKAWQSASGDVVTKAVPGQTEDAVTMAVDASRRALGAAGVAPEDLETVVFASMTAPYEIKECSAAIASMLGTDAFTLDVRGAARSGVGGLLTAARLPESGPALVIGAEVPRGAPGSDVEARSGGGSGALVLSGDGNGRITDWASRPTDFTAEHQLRSRESRTADPRFARQRYTELLTGVVADLEADDLDEYETAVVHGLPGESGTRGARQLGLDEGALHDSSLVPSVGDIGSAGPLAELCSALSTAQAGESVLLVGYGSGAHAVELAVDGPVPASGLESVDDAGRTISYVEYLRRTGGLTKDIC